MPTHTGELLFWSRRVRVASAVGAVAALVLLGGDVASTGRPVPRGECQVASTALSVSTPQPCCPQGRHAEDLTAASSSEDVNPAAAVSVAAFSGTLDDVTMVNDADKPIPGVLTRDKKGMAPSEPTRLWAHLHHDHHRPRARRHAVARDLELHHLSPDYQAAVYLDTTAGPPIQDGGTYGIGTVVVARSIRDRRQSRRGEAPTSDHQPARCRILELGRRPDRPLAT